MSSGPSYCQEALSTLGYLPSFCHGPDSNGSQPGSDAPAFPHPNQPNPSFPFIPGMPGGSEGGSMPPGGGNGGFLSPPFIPGQPFPGAPINPWNPSPPGAFGPGDGSVFPAPPPGSPHGGHRSPLLPGNNDFPPNFNPTFPPGTNPSIPRPTASVEPTGWDNPSTRSLIIAFIVAASVLVLCAIAVFLFVRYRRKRQGVQGRVRGLSNTPEMQQPPSRPAPLYAQGNIAPGAAIAASGLAGAALLRRRSSARSASSFSSSRFSNSSSSYGRERGMSRLGAGMILGGAVAAAATGIDVDLEDVDLDEEEEIRPSIGHVEDAAISSYALPAAVVAAAAIASRHSSHSSSKSKPSESSVVDAEPFHSISATVDDASRPRAPTNEWGMSLEDARRAAAALATMTAVGGIGAVAAVKAHHEASIPVEEAINGHDGTIAIGNVTASHQVDHQDIDETTTVISEHVVTNTAHMMEATNTPSPIAEEANEEDSSAAMASPNEVQSSTSTGSRRGLWNWLRGSETPIEESSTVQDDAVYRDTALAGEHAPMIFAALAVNETAPEAQSADVTPPERRTSWWWRRTEDSVVEPQADVVTPDTAITDLKVASVEQVVENDQTVEQTSVSVTSQVEDVKAADATVATCENDKEVPVITAHHDDEEKGSRRLSKSQMKKAKRRAKQSAADSTEAIAASTVTVISTAASSAIVNQESHRKEEVVSAANVAAKKSSVKNGKKSARASLSSSTKNVDASSSSQSVLQSESSKTSVLGLATGVLRPTVASALKAKQADRSKSPSPSRKSSNQLESISNVVSSNVKTKKTAKKTPSASANLPVSDDIKEARSNTALKIDSEEAEEARRVASAAVSEVISPRPIRSASIRSVTLALDDATREKIEEIVEEVTVDENGNEIDRKVISRRIVDGDGFDGSSTATTPAPAVPLSESATPVTTLATDVIVQTAHITPLTIPTSMEVSSLDDLKTPKGKVMEFSQPVVTATESTSPSLPFRLLGDRRPVKSPVEEANDLEYFPPPPPEPKITGMFSVGSAMGSHILRQRMGASSRKNSEDMPSAWRQLSRSATGSNYAGSENGESVTTSSPSGTWPRRISAGQRMGTVGAMGIGAGLERKESIASLVSRGSGSLGRKNSLASLVQSASNRESFSGRASVVGPEDIIMDVSDEGASSRSSASDDGKQEEQPQWADWFKR